MVFGEHTDSDAAEIDLVGLIIRIADLLATTFQLLEPPPERWLCFRAR